MPKLKRWSGTKTLHPMRRYLLACSLFGALCSLAQSKDAHPKRIYLLKNDQTKAWCGYRDEAFWKRRVDEVVALDVASVLYEGGRPREIEVTAEDTPDAGDWIVFENYTLDQDGVVLSLRRTTNSATFGVGRIEIFSKIDGRLVRTGDKYQSLETGSPVGPIDLELEERKPVVKLTAFPFYSALHASERAPNSIESCKK